LSASLIYVIGISDIIYNLLKTFGFTINIELLKLAIIVSLFFVLKTNLKFYEKIERGLVVGLIALVFGIIILLFLMKPDLSNFYSILSNTSVPIFYFAISLGPFLFASMDTTTTPQVYKLLNYDYRKTTYSITLAYVVILVLYTLFITAFLNTFGSNIKPIAINNLAKYNLFLYILGVIVVILAMTTSMLNFSYIMVDSLKEVYKIPKNKGRLAVVLPLLLSLLLPKEIGKVIGILATVSIFFLIFTIVFLYLYVDWKEHGLKAFTTKEGIKKGLLAITILVLVTLSLARELFY
jgi:hypothetical protein